MKHTSMVIAAVLSLTTFAFAGSSGNSVGSNQSWSGSVTLPNAGTGQIGVQAAAFNGRPSTSTESGLFGYNSVTSAGAPQFYGTSGAVAAGTYNISLSVSGSGYAYYSLSW